MYLSHIGFIEEEKKKLSPDFIATQHRRILIVQ